MAGIVPRGPIICRRRPILERRVAMRDCRETKIQSRATMCHCRGPIILRRHSILYRRVAMRDCRVTKIHRRLTMCHCRGPIILCRHSILYRRVAKRDSRETKMQGRVTLCQYHGSFICCRHSILEGRKTLCRVHVPIISRHTPIFRCRVPVVDSFVTKVQQHVTLCQDHCSFIYCRRSILPLSPCAPRAVRSPINNSPQPESTHGSIFSIKRKERTLRGCGVITDAIHSRITPRSSFACRIAPKPGSTYGKNDD